MKTITILFLVLIAMSCKKETVSPTSQTAQVTFYMTPTTHNWNLLVDGQDKGALRGTSQMPVCSDPDFITLTLSIGSHSIDSKSLDGLAWGSPINYSVTDGCHSYKVR